MRWFCKYREKYSDEDAVLGPFLEHADAVAASESVQSSGGEVVNASFSAPDNYLRTWRPREVAVVTKHDGVYRVMSDGSESKIDE